MMYLGDQAVGLNHMISTIGSAARLESGTFNTNEDTDISTVTIQHSLGVLPDFMFIVTEPFDLLSTSPKYLISGYFCYGNTLTQNVSTDIYYWYEVLYNSGTSSASARTGKKKEVLASQSTFTFVNLSNNVFYFKANTTYYYVLGKFNTQEVTANV